MAGSKLMKNGVRRSGFSRMRRSIRDVSNNTDFFSMAVTDIVNAIGMAVTDTTFLFFAAFSAWLYYQHCSSDNVVLKFLDENPDNALSKWARANIDKVVGAGFFLPVLIKTPSKYLYLVCAGVAGSIFLMPTFELWVYVIAAVVLFVYLKCRRKSTRLTLFAGLALFLYFMVSFKQVKLYKPITAMAPTRSPSVSVTTSPAGTTNQRVARSVPVAEPDVVDVRYDDHNLAYGGSPPLVGDDKRARVASATAPTVPSKNNLDSMLLGTASVRGG